MSIGGYLEIGLAIVALIVVPAAIIKAWWPAIGSGMRRLLRLPWAALCSLFVVADDGADTYVSPHDAWRALVGLFWRNDPPVMSNNYGWDADSSASAGQVRHQGVGSVPLSAAPNTDDTEPVPGATGASILDISARDIMRASVLAELLDSGLLTNRDKAICQIFHCSKASSTRPDAPFQVALRLVEQHRAKKKPEYVGDMIARVEREIAEQH